MNLFSTKLILLLFLSPLVLYIISTKTEELFYLYIFYVPIQCIITSEFVTKNPALSGTTFTIIGGIKDFFLFLIFIGLLINFLMRKIKIKKDLMLSLIFLFVFLCFIYMVISPNLKAAVLEFRNLTEFSLAYFLVLVLLNIPEKIKTAIKCFLASGLLVSIYAFYVLLNSFIGYGYEFGVMPEHIVGRLTVFGNELTAGAFSTYMSLVAITSFCLILFLRKYNWKKIVLAILFLLSCINIAFTFSRRAYLVMILVASFLLILIKRVRVRLISIGAIALITITIFAALAFPNTLKIFYDRMTNIDPTHITNIGRIIEFKEIISIIREHHYLGRGLGVSGSAGITFPFPEYIYSHNIYTAIFLQMGFLGLFLFLIIIGVTIFRGLNPKHLRRVSSCNKSILLGSSLCVFTLAFQSIFSITMFVFPFNFYFWFFSGIVTVLHFNNHVGCLSLINRDQTGCQRQS